MEARKPYTPKVDNFIHLEFCFSLDYIGAQGGMCLILAVTRLASWMMSSSPILVQFCLKNMTLRP